MFGYPDKTMSLVFDVLHNKGYDAPVNTIVMVGYSNYTILIVIGYEIKWLRPARAV